jgi:hypothetical protein
MAKPSVNRMRVAGDGCRGARTGVNRPLRTFAAPLIVLALLSAPNADKADCGNSADRYAMAVDRVVDALHGYEKCVAASGKRDDCAAEMQALDDAHDNFADAVADAKTCR